MSGHRRFVVRLLAAVTALTAVIVLPSTTSACERYDQTLRHLGTFATASAPTLMAAAGPRLVTVGGGTLQVIADPGTATQTVVGSLSGLGSVSDLAIDGDRALLARGAAGLAVIDLSIPSAPILAGVFVPEASVAAVAPAGTHLAAAGGGWFWLVEAADPAAMSLVGQVATLAAVDLAVTGGCALVSGAAGIASISLADPQQPQPVNVFRDDLGQFAENGFYPEFGVLSVDGDRALVSSLQWDIYVDDHGEYPYQRSYAVLLDLTDPLVPVNIGGEALSATGWALHDGVAYVADTDHVLHVYAGEDFAFRGQVRGTAALGRLAVVDEVALAACGTAGLAAFAVAHPQTILPAATFGTGMAHSARDTWDLGVQTTWSGFASTTTYSVFDLSDPLHPQARLSGASSGWMEAVSASLQSTAGDLVCLAFSSASVPGGSRIYDFSQSPPVSAPVPDLNASVTLVDRLAWVKTDDAMLVSYDASALPDLPQRGSVSIAGYNPVAVPGSACLYSLAAPYHLRGLDLSDPDAPLTGGDLALPGAVTAVGLEGGRAFVACGTALLIVDVSEVAVPALIGTTILGLNVTGLRFDGDLLAAVGAAGFQLVSVAEPSAPVVLSPVVATAESIYGHGVLKDGCFYAGHGYGLTVYEVSDPTMPTLLGHGSGCQGRASFGSGYIVTSGAIMPLACALGPSAVDPGIDGRDVPGAGDLRLAVAPNPFNPRVVVSFTLAHAADVAVDAYDLRGHRIRSLSNGRRDAGPHEIAWDGCDDRGRAVPSGQYLLRLSGPALPPRVAKVILAR